VITERPRRVGVMGGTFDPPHLGHLAAASEVHHRLGLDEVVFVPTGDPWQKADRRITPAAHRLAMVRAAIAADARFSVSEVDIRRSGPTYTVDTLADLAAELGAESPQGPPELFVILGADALAGLPTWHRAADVVAACALVGVTRPGIPLAHPGEPAGEVIMIEMPGTDISSTQVRERFGANVPNTYLVPDSVIAYVREHALYGGAA
jgi:nicotinate-nucleotide adenylyltransferase